MPRHGFHKLSPTTTAWRSLALRLAVAALLFQAFFPLLHQPLALAGRGLDGTIVICTGYGFKVVPAADLEFPAPEHEPGDAASGNWCPACFASHAPAAIVPSPIPALASLPVPAVYSALLRDDQPPAGPEHRQPQPRAPPIVA